MRQLTVLAVSPLGQELLSVQFVFSQAGTELRCGFTVAEAACFLSQHPGTLVICEGSSKDSARQDSLSHLLGVGRPSAVVLIADPMKIESASRSVISATYDLRAKYSIIRSC